MTEHEQQSTDESTPASPDPAPAKAHGDAFLDQSGSRQGTPPDDDASGDDTD